MGASIHVAVRTVCSFNEVDPNLFYLFPRNVLRGKEVTKDTISSDINSPPDAGDFEIFLRTAPAGVLKDRLDVLGFGDTYVKEAFEESLKLRIKFAALLVQELGDRNKKFQEELEKLQKLDYGTWVQLITAYISSKCSAKVGEEVRAYDEDRLQLQLAVDESPLHLLQNADHRIVLRAILEGINEQEVVTLDLIDLAADGWREVQEKDGIQEVARGVPPIIITEGTYDVQVLKGAFEVLKPHLVPYIRFLDYNFKNEGGASFAVNTLKSFAAAGISNRIVAIFDNDSAAREAVKVLNGIDLPPQYKVIHYPDIDLANEYPTLGPQGNVTMNVNGLAGSIELYLGIDVLKNDKGNLMPVQWKGYMSKVQSYQGELLNKSLVQKAFNEKLKAAKTDRKNVDQQDWSGLNAILDKLIETLRQF
jgi:hypothetical protein